MKIKRCFKLLLCIIIILNMFSFAKAGDEGRVILEKTILSWDEIELPYNFKLTDFHITYTYDKQLKSTKTSEVYDYLDELVSGPIIHEGDKIIYKITLQNVGTEILNTEITDEIQVDVVDYLSSSATGGATGYNSLTGIVSWAGTINPGETITITIETKVKTLQPGQTIGHIEKNIANIKVNDIDITPVEDEEEYTIVKPNILTSKTSNAYRQGDLNSPIPNLVTYVHQGDYIVYTITVENAGQVTEKAIKIFDPINTAILNPISETATRGDVVWNDTEERFEWTGTLAPGQTAVIELTVEIKHTTATETYVIMENVATIEVNGEDDDPIEDDKEYNVSDYEFVALKVSEVYDCNLQPVEKTGTSTVIHEGDMIRYLIFLDNSEENPVEVEITDQIQIDVVEYLNSSATYLESLEPDGVITYDEITGLFTWSGIINPEETVIIVILVKVKELPIGVTSKVLNKNAIDIELEGEPGETVEDEDEYIVAKTDISAVKKSVVYDYLNNPVSDSTIHEGDKITYTIEVTNNGIVKENYVVITDNIDINALEYLGSSSEGKGSLTWNVETGELIWNGSLNPAETVEITIETKAKPIPDGQTSVYIGKNIAEVKANNEIEDPAEDPDDYTVVKSNVTTSKTSIAYHNSTLIPSEEEFIHEGDEIIYTITAKNEGEAEEKGIEITDNIHSGLQYVSSSSGSKGSITLDGTVLTWKGDLAPAETVTITITVTVKTLPAGTGSLHIGSNIAGIKVQGEEDDPIEDEEEYDVGKVILNGTKTSEVYNHAGEPVAKTNPTTMIREGYEIVYTITLENSGSESAYTEILDELQIDVVEYVSSSVTKGAVNYSSITGEVTWEGTINAGETIIITIRVKAIEVPDGKDSQTLEGNTVNIKVDGEDEDPIEDEDEYEIVKTDISATKTSIAYDYEDAVVPLSEPGLTLVHEGNKIVYTITVVNNGIETEDEVIVTDNINTDVLKYIGSSSEGKGTIEWDGVTGQLKWTGSLDSGESVTIEIETEVKKLPDGVSSLNIGKNTANIKANNEDKDPVEDPDDYTAVKINVITTKTSIAYKGNDGTAIPNDALFIHEGDYLIYTITITNAGEAEEKVVEVLDPINTDLLKPIAGLSSADVGILTWNSTESRFEWTGTLAPTETATIELALEVEPVDITKAYTIGKNRVTIKVGGEEQDPVEDEKEYNVGYIDLSAVKVSDVYNHQGNIIMKTGTNTLIHEGDEIVYKIIMQNDGNEPAETTITDILQTEAVEYISSSATDGVTSYNSETGAFTWEGTIAEHGGGVVITIRVKAKDVPAGQTSQILYANTVSVEANGEDEEPIEDDSEYTIVKTDVTAEKTSVAYDYLNEPIIGTSDLHEGDKIVYTITVRNNGIEREKGIVITDDINITGLNYVSSNSGGRGIIDWSAGTGRLTWTGDLNPGETAVIVITVIVKDLPDGETEYNIGQNIGTLKANDVERDPIEDEEDYNVKKSNVVISKESKAYKASDSSQIPAGEFIHEGDNITYTITAENKGNISEKDIRITDLIDKEFLEYVSHSGTKTSVTWDSTAYRLQWVGTLDAGETAVITLTVKVRTKAELPNGFGIASNVVTTRVNGEAGVEEDPDDYTVGKINISGSKTSQAYDIDGIAIARTNLYAGETIDYTITLSNAGNESETIALKDLLPTGLTIISSPDLTSGEIEELISPSGLEVVIPAGGNLTIRYKAEVTGLPGNGNMRNSITIDEKTIDDDKTYEITGPTITLEKTSNNIGAILKYEDKIVYTIKVTLTEGNIAKNVVIRDKIPTGTTVSDLMDADRIENGDVVFELGDIEGDGEYVEVSFEVQVTENNENGTTSNLSQITNTARVTADNINGEIESNAINNELEQYTVIPVRKSLVEERTEEVTYYYPTLYANGVDVKQNETATLMARSPDGQLICTITVTRQNKEYKIMTVTMNRTDIVLINGIKTVYSSAATLSDPAGAFRDNPTHVHNWYPGGYPGTQIIPPSNYYGSGNDAVFVMLEDVIIHTGVYEQRYYKDQVSVPANTFKAHISGTTIYGELYEDTIIIPAGGSTEFVNVPYGTYTVTELDMAGDPISEYDVLITTDVNDPLHGYSSVPSLSGITAGATVPTVYINNITKE